MGALIVAALQPGYLPWLGYFDLMKRADLFIVEDSLQYTKQDWRNRNRIRTAAGAEYLTVPVQKGATGRTMREVCIDNGQPWGRRQWNLLRANYAKAPYWETYAAFIEETLKWPWELLLDLDLHLADFLAGEFEISTPTKLLSDVDVTFGSDKTQSLIDLTQAVGASAFIEGASGKSFIECDRFAAAGLEIQFQDYVCRAYPQQYKPFVSHLSALDLLLNVGPAGAALI